MKEETPEPKSNQLSICFFGSSGDADPLDPLENPELWQYIENIAAIVLSLDYERFKIITGGYHGIMYLVAHIFKEKAEEFQKIVQTVGVTCEAYPILDAESADYQRHDDVNNKNDLVIHAESFPARIQAMIEMADTFVVLEGRQGTLNELLMTAEIYGYPTHALKHKKTKILVDGYWQRLLVNTKYFRKFKNVTFFKSLDELKDELLLIKANVQRFPPSDHEFPADLKSAFSYYNRRIDDILYGNLNSEAVRQRLRFHQNLLASDFGYMMVKSNSRAEVEFVSRSTVKYQDLLKAFFEKHNSIMLTRDGASDSPFEVEYFDHTVVKDVHLHDFEEDKVPIESDQKLPAKFIDWAGFIKKSGYGQTLIWRSIRQGKKKDFDLNLSIFLLFNCYLPSRKIEKIRQLTDDFFLKVSTDVLIKLFNEKEADLRQQAIKAAISQVMARNTSHNIGAHVLNKLIDARFLKEFSSFKAALRSYSPLADLDNMNDHEPFHQLAIFNNYVKCRMDYLADISFGTPLMQTNKRVYQDIFKELDKVRLLMEHISGLSDFTYRVEFLKNNNPINSENDMLIAMPNDLLGMQSIYNILENIIRNTAKHSQKEKHKLTVFTVNFIDETDEQRYGDDKERILRDFCAVEVYDNVTINDPYSLKPTEKDNYFMLTKKAPADSIPAIDWLVFRQNCKLNDDILHDNKLRTGSLGLIEMKASTAYLRKRDGALINDEAYKIQFDESWESDLQHKYFLKAIKKDNFFGYRFFVPRPAVILITLNVTRIYIKTNDHYLSLRKKGVWIVGRDEFAKRLEDGKVYNHEFVLADRDIEGFDNLVTDFQTSLPQRILKAGQGELEVLIGHEELGAFESYCWRKWNDEVMHLQYAAGREYPTRGGKFSDLVSHSSPKSFEEAIRSGIYFYLDSLSSNAQRKLPGFKSDLKTYQNELKRDESARLRLGESVYAKVLVIDERVQENAEEKYIDTSLRILYKMSGITVPEKNINLSANSMDDTLADSIERLIVNFYSCGSGVGAFNKKIDFILIHYSILERMFNSDKQLIYSYLIKIANGANIVVTSGRGEPDELPREVRFVNLSSVIQAFIDIRSKYLVNYILHSSRRSSKSKPLKPNETNLHHH